MPIIPRAQPLSVTPDLTPPFVTPDLTPTLVTPTSPLVTPGLTRGPFPFTLGYRIKTGMTRLCIIAGMTVQ
jgi:hypothetical protein